MPGGNFMDKYDLKKTAVEFTQGFTGCFIVSICQFKLW